MTCPKEMQSMAAHKQLMFILVLGLLKSLVGAQFACTHLRDGYRFDSVAQFCNGDLVQNQHNPYLLAGKYMFRLKMEKMNSETWTISPDGYTIEVEKKMPEFKSQAPSEYSSMLFGRCPQTKETYASVDEFELCQAEMLAGNTSSTTIICWSGKRDSGFALIDSLKVDDVSKVYTVEFDMGSNVKAKINPNVKMLGEIFADRRERSRGVMFIDQVKYKGDLPSDRIFATHYQLGEYDYNFEWTVLKERKRLKKFHSHFEVTGMISVPGQTIFSESMVLFLLWNGTHHLYCLHHNCQQRQQLFLPCSSAKVVDYFEYKTRLVNETSPPNAFLPLVSNLRVTQMIVAVCIILFFIGSFFYVFRKRKAHKRPKKQKPKTKTAASAEKTSKEKTTSAKSTTRTTEKSKSSKSRAKTC